MSHSIYTNLIEELVPNLPSHIGEPIELDLVLDNGAFNGLYLLGVLLYLKVLEEKGRIKINRISGSSIGAIYSVLYFNDMLQLTDMFFHEIRKTWKNNCNFSTWREHIKVICKDVDFTKINDRIFINYFDTSSCKEHILSNFNSKEELIETLSKSCFIPLLINGDLTYNNCIDGFNPMLFNERTDEDRKILFVHLFTIDKIRSSINVKNDKNTTFRAIEGIYEVHKFFLNEKQSLCSYVNDWNTRQLLTYRIRQILYYLVIYIINIIVIVKNYIPDSFYELPIWNLISQLANKIHKDLILQSCF
tara:strand:- start:1369 stop:2280 length:912 start_codon:yes stop_codon:yes gene_type:complete